MLVRVNINNVLSFGEEREFNMLPNKGLRTLPKHKYQFKNLELLKLASLYGANGAGKSNLIHALRFLQETVTDEEIPIEFRDSQFRFQEDAENTTQTIAIEFISHDTPFYYGLEIVSGVVTSEELYLSGLGKAKDQLIYERKTTQPNVHTLTFDPAFENEPKSQVLKQVLIEDFIKSNQTVLKLLSNRENSYLKIIKLAYEWISKTLVIIHPGSRPIALEENIEKHVEFRQYAEEIMCAFNVGIASIYTKKIKVDDYFGREKSDSIEELIGRLEEGPSQMAQLEMRNGKKVLLVKEDNEIFVKQLQLEHRDQKNRTALFDLEEESDGTIRLLDFVPAFREIILNRKVYVIDEIERSIHPLLIRELLRKFSMDENTKGQLIFTTHESNLLDQTIFRQDEIWFAEKDQNGVTDLYSLNDFKEHKTIDIRKGYLSGRYGSIPFLGNLNQLNWHAYDPKEPTI